MFRPGKPSFAARAALLLLLALPLAPHAAAQGILRPLAAGAAPGPRSHTLLTTFSGGISLGAYQAGVNWAIMEAMRGSRHDPDFRRRHALQDLHFGAAAGASAGNINAVMWAIEACSDVPAGRGPHESLFWKTWMPVGIDSLLRPEPFKPDSDDLALLDRRFFGTVQAALHARIAATAFRPGCEVPVGITLTRVLPEVVSLKGSGLQVQTQRFVTVLSGRSASGAAVPFVFHSIHPNPTLLGKLGQVRLAQRDTTAPMVVDNLFTIVRASSAFPVAFAPVELKLHNPHRNGDTAVIELFTDGGLFDNNPVDVANLMQDWKDQRGQRTLGGKALLPWPLWDAPQPRPRRLLYVDPDVRRGPRSGPESAAAENTVRPPVPGGLRSVVQMLGGSVNAAREYELSTLDRHPEGRTPFQLVVTTRRYPLVGERMGAFAAFLNRGFREYDFYVGAYDALHSLTLNDAFTLRRPPEDKCDQVPWMDALALELGMPAHGRAFIRELANQEHGCAETLPPVEVTEDGSVRLGFYRLVLAAQQGAAAGKKPNCDGRTVPEWILCTGEMDALMGSVRGRLSSLPGYGRACLSGGGRRRRDPGSAWAELELCALADDAPADRMQELMERALARMPAMEREVLRRERRRDSTATPSPLAEIGSELAGFLYYAGVRPVAGWQWGSLPRGASRALALLPAYLSTEGDWSAVEAGWQPTYYMRSSPGIGLGLTGALRLNWYTDDEGRRLRRETTAYGAAGIGPRVAYRQTGGGGLLLSRVEVTALATTRGPVGELALTLFADRLRVGLRGVDGGPDLADGDAFMFTVGLNDLPGLAYWITALAGN